MINPGDTHDGIDIAGASGYGLWIGYAGKDAISIWEAGDDGMKVWIAEDNGVYVSQTGNDGLHIWEAGDDGVCISDAADDGLEIYDAGDAPTHWSPEDYGYGNTKDGIDIAGAKDFGLWVGYAGREGVHIQEAVDNGVYVGSSGSDGVRTHNASGDGLHIAEADEDGIYVQDVADDGLDIYDAGNATQHAVPADFHPYEDSHNGIQIGGARGYGLWIGHAGIDGIYVHSASADGLSVESADATGVSANTTRISQEWGFQTPDKIYAGASLVSGDPLMLVAQNGGNASLETRDVVVASGMAAALGEGSTPVLAVQRAEGTNSTAVIGVVYRRFIEEQDVETTQRDGDLERRSTGRTRSTDGPVAPGDYMLIVVMGPAKVKVDGSAGNLQAGDLLSTASVSGAAAAAQQVEAGGVASYAPGTTIGKALEPLAKGDDGLIWAMVTLQ